MHAANPCSQPMEKFFIGLWALSHSFEERKHCHFGGSRFFFQVRILSCAEDFIPSRGGFALRNGTFLPMVRKPPLSLIMLESFVVDNLETCAFDGELPILPPPLIILRRGYRSELIAICSLPEYIHHASQSEWDAEFLWLGLAFNSAVHESTKCTSINCSWVEN
jgi:hypothetical protein